MNLKEEIKKITGDTGSEWDLTEAGQEKLVQLFKTWALKMVGENYNFGANDRTISFDPHDSDIYAEGSNETKDAIRENIDKTTK